MLNIIRTDSTNKDFQDLVFLLDTDLKKRDGEEHTFYRQFNHIDSIKHAVVVYKDKQPIACGAFKQYSDSTVEIKRMFVHSDHRGHGIAKKVLHELEQWAAELKYNTFILETGKRQPEAIRLYEKAGYIRIPNYGQYQNVENSVCMKKDIEEI